jgi:hypothetical protein
MAGLDRPPLEQTNGGRRGLIRMAGRLFFCGARDEQRSVQMAFSAPATGQESHLTALEIAA